RAGTYRGVTDEISNDDYHKAYHYASNSELELIRTRSPAHVIAKRNEELKETPSKLLGKALHANILEPEKKLVVCEPEVNKRTNKGKEEIAEFVAANQGKIIVSPKDWETVQRVTEAIWNHKEAA